MEFFSFLKVYTVSLFLLYVDCTFYLCVKFVYTVSLFLLHVDSRGYSTLSEARLYSIIISTQMPTSVGCRYIFKVLLNFNCQDCIIISTFCRSFSFQQKSWVYIIHFYLCRSWQIGICISIYSIVISTLCRYRSWNRDWYGELYSIIHFYFV